jgi:hypothetical protein
MSKLKIAGVTLALVFAASGSAFAQTAADVAAAEKAKTPSVEGVVTNAASCQYEGGFLGKVEGANVCMAPIRGADFSTQAYDGQNLGVMSCSGNGSFANETTGTYCRIFLEPKPRKKTRAELEAELEALTEAELAQNADVDVTN